MPIKSMREVIKHSLNYTINLRRYLRGDSWIKVVYVIDFLQSEKEIQL